MRMPKVHSYTFRQDFTFSSFSQEDEGTIGQGVSTSFAFTAPNAQDAFCVQQNYFNSSFSLF